MADLLEPEPAEVPPEEVGGLVVGDEEVDPPVVVEVGGEHPHAAAVGVDDPGLPGDLDEPAAVVAVERGRGGTGTAARSCRAGWRRTSGRGR